MINDSYVKYYMPADSDLEDKSVGHGYDRTAGYSGVVVDNTVFHEGSGSAKFDGSSQLYTYITEADDMMFRTDKFTIAFWYRFIALKDTEFIGFHSHGGFWNTSETGWRCWYDNANHRLYFQYYDVTSGLWEIDLYCSWSPVVDTWYDIKFARDGADFWIVIDGNIQVLTGTYPTALTDIYLGYSGAPKICWIGVRYVVLTASKYANGYFDDVWVARSVVRLFPISQTLIFSESLQLSETTQKTLRIIAPKENVTKKLGDIVSVNTDGMWGLDPVTFILTQTNGIWYEPYHAEEQLSLIDSFRSFISQAKSELMILADNIANFLRLHKFDTLDLLDTISGTSGIGAIKFLYINESLILQDLALTILQLRKYDSLSLVDTILKTLRIKKYDTITLTEAILKTITVHFYDSLALLDSAALSRLYTMYPQELLALVDNVALTLKLRKQEQIILQDTLLKTMRLYIQDTLLLEETPEVAAFQPPALRSRGDMISKVEPTEEWHDITSIERRRPQ